MEELTPVVAFVGTDRLFSIARALVLIGLGLLMLRLSGLLVTRLQSRGLDRQQAMLSRRVVSAVIFMLVLTAVLHELGFNLGVFLGAAGILTVAIGFASQTSASNLISGLFLIGERPFAVGEVIKVGDLTGEVLSVDLLSVKLRTMDNLFVRVPNETLIKSNITNLARFPIRRFDLMLSVSLSSDLKQVNEVLMAAADANPICLVDPKPLFIFQGFGQSSIDLQFSFWGARERFLDLRNSMAEDIHRALREAGIEIPFPQRVVTLLNPADDKEQQA